MWAALLLAYVAVLVAAIVFAVRWSRKKKSDYHNLRRQHSLTPFEAFLVKPLKKDWYVSVEFCLGFALAGYLAVLVLRAI